MQNGVGIARILYLLSGVNIGAMEDFLVSREHVAEESLQRDERHALEVLQKLLLNVFRLEILVGEVLLLGIEELSQKHHVKLSITLLRNVLILVAS